MGARSARSIGRRSAAREGVGILDGMKSRSGTKKPGVKGHEKALSPEARTMLEAGLESGRTEAPVYIGSFAADEERALAVVDEIVDCEDSTAGLPPGVSVVLRGARRLRTFPANHRMWDPKSGWVHAVRGFLVRLYPPAGAEDARIEQVAAEVRAAGAAGVKVMPRPAGPTVSGSRVEELVVGPPRTMREVVMGLVGVQPSPALEALLAEALDAGSQRAAAEGVLVPIPGPPLFVDLLQLTNWLRYEGTHAIELGPTIYGVTAQQVGDPERSNWIGKSSLLEAIAFVLTGWHRWPTEDAWITRGQKAGGVNARLSDGTQIERQRKKSTQLTVTTPDGRILNNEHAQKEIDQRVGLGADDFFATCFFKQKDLARLIKAKPAERLEIVRGWLALEPVVYADAFVRTRMEAKLGALNRAAELLGGYVKRMEAMRRDAIPGAYVHADVVDFAGWIGAREREELEANEHARAVEAQAAKQKAANDGIERWEQDAASAERRVKVRGLIDQERGELVRMQKVLASLTDEHALLVEHHERHGGIELETLKKRLPVLQEALQGSLMGRRAAMLETQQKKQLAAGAFDGKCPVALIECPATAAINAPRKANRKLYEDAQAAEIEASNKLLAAQDAKDKVSNVFIMREQVEKQIERKWTEVERQQGKIREQDAAIAKLVSEHALLEPAAKRIERDGQPVRKPVVDVGPAWEAVRAAALRAANVLRMQSDYAEWEGERNKASARMAELELELVVLRRAALILGKSGAQKAIAVGELRAIELAANGMLAGAGVDLSITIRWGTPSATLLTPSCDECGHLFQVAKQKACPRCEAPRGPKIDDKLEVELSDRSGAAEDLAGIALQLAASAWLRARRGAAWAMVAIDEPFGALDVANGRALAVHLAGMLTSGAFRQGFVIAHTPAAMDALPSRLQVTGTGGREGRSTVEVMR